MKLTVESTARAIFIRRDPQGRYDSASQGDMDTMVKYMMDRGRRERKEVNIRIPKENQIHGDAYRVGVTRSDRLYTTWGAKRSVKIA